MTQLRGNNMPPPPFAGVILCGGAGSRIGGEKALLPFLGGTMLDAVIARVAPQLSPLALNVAADRGEIYRARYPDYPLLLDAQPDRIGPLAGVIAGLECARTLGDVEWLATFPCDTPFLPRDLLAQLSAPAHKVPVFAHHGGRLHGICAVWPVDCLDALKAGVEEGKLRSLHSAMEALGGLSCPVDANEYAFFNINTREDLARAEELASGI
jgi:molybdopterin-guanine dinucleotide biosynthesis protein A